MKLIIRIAVAVVLTLAVLAGGLLLLPGERIARIAADRLEAQTGRKLTFGGDVQLSFWPSLGIKADAVSLSNADWAGPEPFLRAERLTIAMEAAALLRGDVRITGLSAILPQLNLETREDGTGNWQFAAAGAGVADPNGSRQPETDTQPVLIRDMRLTGASLRYAAQGAEPVLIDNVDLTLDWPERNRPAEVQLTLRPAGEPVQITAKLADFAAFLGGRAAPLEAALSTAEGSARFFGTAALDGTAKGRLTADAPNAAGFARRLGVPAAKLPQDLLLPVSLSAEAALDKGGRLALRDLRSSIGGNRLTGAADIQPGPVPRITAQLNGGALDVSSLLRDLTGASGRQGGSAATATRDSAGQHGLATGWPDSPIDAAPLGLANGTLNLSFDSLDTGLVQLGASRLTLTNERSRAVLQMQPAAAFGGSLRGQLVANNRSGLSVGGKLAFEGVRLERALGALLDFDNLTSLAEGELEFLGSGASVAQIMRSLSGKGRVAAGKGFFTGFDLEELMRSGSGNGGSTLFESLSASFTIKDGTLRNQDLLMRLKQLSVTGAGQVGLGARSLDYTFTPALERDGARLLSIPVHVIGPWHDPQIRPDLARAVEPELDEIKERAKDKLRRKLEEKLNEELGLELAPAPEAAAPLTGSAPSAPLSAQPQAPAAETAPAQDLNQILKDRIEQEAREQLKRLLGGN